MITSLSTRFPNQTCPGLAPGLFCAPVQVRHCGSSKQGQPLPSAESRVGHAQHAPSSGELQ